MYFNIGLIVLANLTNINLIYFSIGNFKLIWGNLYIIIYNMKFIEIIIFHYHYCINNISIFFSEFTSLDKKLQNTA